MRRSRAGENDKVKPYVLLATEQRSRRWSSVSGEAIERQGSEGTKAEEYRDTEGTRKTVSGWDGVAVEVHPMFQRYRRILQYIPEPVRRLSERFDV